MGTLQVPEQRDTNDSIFHFQITKDSTLTGAIILPIDLIARCGYTIHNDQNKRRIEMETIQLPQGTLNYRTGYKDIAMRAAITEKPDQVHGLSSFWYDDNLNLICTLIGITWKEFLELTAIKFAECMEA
jgi:hypothetical protein